MFGVGFGLVGKAISMSWNKFLLHKTKPKQKKANINYESSLQRGETALENPFLIYEQIYTNSLSQQYTKNT